MYTLKIKVTKEILERSKMCGIGSESIGANCAFALAVRDIFPGAYVSHLTVDPYRYNAHGHVMRIAGEYAFPMTKEMREFVGDFDDSTPEERVAMPEQEFTLSIPDRVINTINIDEIKPLLVNHPNLQLLIV